MRRLRWIPLVVVLGMAVAACGGDDVGLPTGTGPDGGSGVSTTEPGVMDFGAPTVPEIDPAAMPSPGDVQFEVEGTTHAFAAAEAIESAYSCSVDSGAVVVEVQLAPGALLLQASRADGETWQGSVTISPRGSERIYFSSPGFDGTFAVEGTMAVYEGDFYWRTSDDPGSREEAGTGMVRVTC